MPQTTGAEELATPPLKRAVITLPEGLVVNPSSANGLGACSLAQVGISASGQPDGDRPTCPEDSKIGTLELESPCAARNPRGPDLPRPPGREPIRPLARDLPCRRRSDQRRPRQARRQGRSRRVVGQLQTVVDQSPQLPFSALRTHFFGGARAALRTPATCGSFEVTSALTPWSAPESGPPATPSAGFQTSQAAGPGACPISPCQEPNHPAFSAATLSPQAGACSPFVVHGARADGEQPITQARLGASISPAGRT